MSAQSRIELYKNIEEHRKRPLLVYVTSKRQGVIASMATDALPYIIEQLDALPENVKEVDFLIASYGGDPMVAWRIMSLVRQRVEKVAVLIPQSAYSAATLFALGADEIFMHPNGHLGPVDMQITTITESGQSARFSTEDVSAFLEFVRDALKLTDQEHIRVLFEAICKEVGSLGIGFTVRSSKLAVDLGERLLALHMKDDDRGAKLRSIVENMSKNFQSHSYPVNRKEARDVGLPVNKASDKTLEKLMWDAWLDLEAEMKEREPYNALYEILNSEEGKKLLLPVPLANSTPTPTAPPTDPNQPNLINLTPDTSKSVNPVDFMLKTALIESSRLCHECVTRGTILAQRSSDLAIQFSQITTFRGWEKV